MNETLSEPQAPSGRVDGLERELAALQARLAATVFWLRSMAVMMVLALAGVVWLLVFPDATPAKLLATRRPPAASDSQDLSQSMKQDIYELKQALNRDMLDMQKELSENIAEAKRQIRSDGIESRKLLNIIKEDLGTSIIDQKKLLPPPKK